MLLLAVKKSSGPVGMDEEKGEKRTKDVEKIEYWRIYIGLTMTPDRHRYKISSHVPAMPVLIMLSVSLRFQRPRARFHLERLTVDDLLFIQR